MDTWFFRMKTDSNAYKTDKSLSSKGTMKQFILILLSCCFSDENHSILYSNPKKKYDMDNLV